MAFKKRFCLSDESINSYGMWIRTAGIDLTQAKRNCPVYYNHNTWGVPLGHAENFSVEGDKLFCDIIIEGANEEEKTYIRKLENGDIKGCSGGFEITEWNDNALALKEGQSRPTIWLCELYEVSLAPLPGNKNALALKKDGLITLSADNANPHLPALNTPFNMKQIALKLGLPESANEAEIVQAIVRLNRTKKNAELMRKHIEDAAAATLQTDEQKALFVQLSKTDFASALSFLALNKGVTTEAPADAPAVPGVKGGIVKDLKVTDLIQKGKASLAKAGTGDEAKQTFDYLQKHNPVELSRIRKEEPDTYKELAAGYGNGVRYTGTK